MLMRNRFYNRLMEADTGDGNGGEGVEDGEVTYTQEQLNAKIADSNKALEDKLKAQFEQEYQDKLKNGIEEYKKTSNMKDDELAKYKIDQELKELRKWKEEQEKVNQERLVKDMKNEALKTLTGKEYNFDGESADTILGLLNYESADTLSKSITDVTGVINKLVNSIADKRLTTNTKPSSQHGNVGTANLDALRAKLGLK